MSLLMRRQQTRVMAYHHHHHQQQQNSNPPILKCSWFSLCGCDRNRDRCHTTIKLRRHRPFVMSTAARIMVSPYHQQRHRIVRTELFLNQERCDSNKLLLQFPSCLHCILNQRRSLCLCLTAAPIPYVARTATKRMIHSDRPIHQNDVSEDALGPQRSDQRQPPGAPVTGPPPTNAIATVRDSSNKTSHDFIRRAQKFCQEELYPIGSIITYRLVVQEIKYILDALGSTSVTDDSEQYVNVAIQLLERLSREPLVAVVSSSSSSTAADVLSSLPPDYYNRIFNKWKGAALRGDSVLSASILTQFLTQNAFTATHGSIKNNIEPFESLGSSSGASILSTGTVHRTKTWKFVQYDIATVSMILQVAIVQTPAKLAPQLVQQLWDQLDLYKGTSDDSNVTYCYNALLKAWAESGLDDAAMKMESIWNDMIHVQKVQPNIVSHHIMLKFYRQQGNVLALESLVSKMVSQQSASSSTTAIRPSLSCWSEVVYCYMGLALQQDTIERHQSLFFIHKGQTIVQLEMVPQRNIDDDTDTAEIACCVESIITTYRDVLLHYKFDTFLDAMKRSPSKKNMISIQQRMDNNNPAISKRNQTRDRTVFSAQAFFEFSKTVINALSSTSRGTST
jgi:hypothetical protein